MFAFLLAPLLAAVAGLPGYTQACPLEQARVVFAATFVAPDNIHPTQRQARLLMDIGTDGKIRRIALTQSSGDATFDDAALAAAKSNIYAAPSQNCITTSFSAPQSYLVPLMSLVPAQPNASAPIAAITPLPPAVPLCVAPFVQLAGIDIPSRREAPGTVEIDVSLSATAHVISVRLAKSSGKPKTDYAATAAARTGIYQFVDQPGCKPTATTYRLQLTYR